MTPVNTPHKCNLRDANEGSPKVSESRRVKFHSLVMLMMHVSHRGRRDLQPTAALSSQRVSACTEEDYGKLKRLIRHAISSMDEIACIGATNLSTLLHFVDASCGVHVD